MLEVDNHLVVVDDKKNENFDITRTLVAPMNGRVVQVLTPNGMLVRKGEPMFLFQPDTTAEYHDSMPTSLDDDMKDTLPITQESRFPLVELFASINFDHHLLQSTIFDLKRGVNYLVESEMKKNPMGNGGGLDDDKTTMYDEDHVVPTTAVISTSETLSDSEDSLDTQITSSFSELPTGIKRHESFIRSLLEKKRSSHAGIFAMEDVILAVQDHDADYCPIAILGDDDQDVMKRYECFKKFATVVDHAGHLFAERSSLVNQPPSDWVEKIRNEWKILEQDLPETIFVRVYESRMDLLRAGFIGPKGTPYHDGLFFFDVCFPNGYPDTPPLVRYHSGGLGMNPNLLTCGEVSLSVPKTAGGREQMWVPGTSTMLQLLVSIQSLIFKTDPLFNDVTYMRRSSVYKEHASLLYNENTFTKSLKTMVYVMNKPPKGFEELVVGHFRRRASDILMACKAYMEGLQVGCPVSDLQEEWKKGSCSTTFKNELASCVNTLVTAFNKIGAKPVSVFTV